MTQVLSLKNKLMMAVVLLTAAALIAATLGMLFSTPAKAADGNTDKKTINISGQAKVTAAPDIAYISLGVISEDKDAKVAQKANAAAMEKVVASIKANGIKDEDIKTENYSITPKYNYIEKTGIGTIVGYTVNNTVSVTVRDLTKTGNIIDSASDSGVNVSSNISFGLSNYEKYYNDALKNAVLAAKKKAVTIAEALGVTLKAPISISEGGGYSPLMNYATYDMKASSAGAATPVQSGSIEITANVNAVYEY
jgi:uncharacterized protein YggE